MVNLFIKLSLYKYLNVNVCYIAIVNSENVTVKLSKPKPNTNQIPLSRFAPPLPITILDLRLRC